MYRRIVRLVLVLGFEAAALVGLLRLGRRPWLQIDWSDLGAWLRVTPPEDALAALVWLAALGCTIWLTGSTLLYLVARASRVPTLIRSVEWMTLPAIRRVTEGALAAVLATSSVTATPAWADPPPPIVVVVEDEGVLVPPGFTAHRVEQPPETVPETAVPPLPVLPHELTADANEPVIEVLVETGDNLWVISRRHLTDALARQPSVEEIAPYWRQVIAENQPRLTSGDPDLIYPGEVVTMPPIT